MHISTTLCGRVTLPWLPTFQLHCPLQTNYPVHNQVTLHHKVATLFTARTTSQLPCTDRVTQLWTLNFLKSAPLSSYPYRQGSSQVSYPAQITWSLHAFSYTFNLPCSVYIEMPFRKEKGKEGKEGNKNKKVKKTTENPKANLHSTYPALKNTHPLLHLSLFREERQAPFSLLVVV